MSTTLSTTAMIAKLQEKFSIGIDSTKWLAFLNEAFRKVNQMQKGGFVWQIKFATINLPPGVQVANALPVDFDPGKSAFLYAITTTTPTKTLIPYKPLTEFTNEQHFKTTAIAMFSSWTFYPNFTVTAPTNYAWTMKLAPDTAFPLAGGIALGFYYHAVNFAPLTAAANAYFPTPDQFDSMIMDLAESEARRIYTASGWDKLAATATQSLNELIGDYRTDRYDLAGVTDITIQAQEKAAERDR